MLQVNPNRRKSFSEIERDRGFRHMYAAFCRSVGIFPTSVYHSHNDRGIYWEDVLRKREKGTDRPAETLVGRNASG